MKILEVAFTGYPVKDMARAREFYEGVLGLTKSRGWGDETNPGWLEYDIGPSCLAIIVDSKGNWPPANAGPAAALEVDDLDAYVKKCRDAGVKFFLEPQESPVCWMTVVLDPDENRLVLHRRKPTP